MPPETTPHKQNPHQEVDKRPIAKRKEVARAFWELSVAHADKFGVSGYPGQVSEIYALSSFDSGGKRYRITLNVEMYPGELCQTIYIFESDAPMFGGNSYTLRIATGDYVEEQARNNLTAVEKNLEENPDSEGLKNVKQSILNSYEFEGKDGITSWTNPSRDDKLTTDDALVILKDATNFELVPDDDSDMTLKEFRESVLREWARRQGKRNDLLTLLSGELEPDTQSTSDPYN